MPHPNLPQRIRAVSFDADDTLWDFERVMRHSLGHVLAALQTRHPTAAAEVSIDAMIAIRNQVDLEWGDSGRSLEDIRTESFQRVVAGTGVADAALAMQLNDIYFAHRFEDIELYGDVLPTFERLRGRYALGLLTNGNSYPDRCGLDGWFTFAVFADAHGARKPAPSIFHAACEQARVQPHELLHVGDSLHNDVFGAQQAGLPTAWLNRAGVANASGVQPDYELRSLRDLLELLPGASAA